MAPRSTTFFTIFRGILQRIAVGEQFEVRQTHAEGKSAVCHCHCEEPTGDVAIRVPSNAKHCPPPCGGAEGERIATSGFALLAMTW